jgi:hypothetical protein
MARKPSRNAHLPINKGTDAHTPDGAAFHDA